MSTSLAAVLLAVIGRGWIDAEDDEGQRRLDDPDDWVRLEIETALRRRVRVVPVLVYGARFPKQAELPEGLQPMLRRNYIEVPRSYFDAAVEKLIAGIEKLSRQLGTQREQETAPKPQTGRDSAPSRESEKETDAGRQAEQEAAAEPQANQDAAPNRRNERKASAERRAEQKAATRYVTSPTSLKQIGEAPGSDPTEKRGSESTTSADPLRREAEIAERHLESESGATQAQINGILDLARRWPSDLDGEPIKRFVLQLRGLAWEILRGERTHADRWDTGGDLLTDAVRLVDELAQLNPRWIELLPKVVDSTLRGLLNSQVLWCDGSSGTYQALRRAVDCVLERWREHSALEGWAWDSVPDPWRTFSA